MVPYEQLHYDPRDNVRPVDQQWVSHLTALMIANGYDKSQPLHCYVRKVDGKDLIYVYKGQHRYLSAGNAIRAGKDLGKIPVVVRDAKTVERAEMVIAEGDWEFGFSYAFNSAGGSSPCKRIDGESPGRYRTRVEAIRAAVQVLTRTLESTSASKAKEMAGVRRWLDKLFTMPDPDWTPEMAREAAQ